MSRDRWLINFFVLALFLPFVSFFCFLLGFFLFLSLFFVILVCRFCVCCSCFFFVFFLFFCFCLSVFREGGGGGVRQTRSSDPWGCIEENLVELVKKSGRMALTRRIGPEPATP